MRHRDDLKRMIPVTSLWHLFRLLRRFPNSALQFAIAQEMNRLPEQLDAIVEESVNHFAVYDNRAEPFHSRPTGQQPSLLPQYAASQKPALRLAALASSGLISIRDHDELAFDYVDYEVRPCRTTKSMPESGQSGYSPGKDMFDLLLVNRRDSLPIVAEVKAAETDRNPFSALIQGLMYSVAMSSESQRDRLARNYPGRFVWSGSGPFVDLYLLLIRYPDVSPHREFLSVTNSVAQKLLQPERAVAQVVRRIVCFDAKLDDQKPAELTLLFAHATVLRMAQPTS